MIAAALLLSLVPQHDELLDAQLRNVHLERREAFLAAWDQASEARRAFVRDAFQARRSRGVPSVYQVSAQFLTEQQLVLDGLVDAAADLSWETRMACSLDLLVLPGAFPAGDGGRANEVIVRVLPATTSMLYPLPEEIDLRLVWVGPQGQEIPARKEPIHKTAFRMPGFEMYLRAPASKPGRWYLVPEVERAGQVGRGQPVPVDCVLDLLGRFDRLNGTLGLDEVQIAARSSLERHLRHGVRDRMAPNTGQLLDGALLAPLATVGDDWAGGRTLRLNLGPAEPKEIVLVVGPRLEDPDWVFCQQAGEAWAAFANKRDAWIFSTVLPMRDPRGADVIGLLNGLRGEFPELPITLLVRGSEVGRLALTGRNQAGPPPFTRVVLNTVISKNATPQRAFDVPTLLLTPLSDANTLEPILTDGASFHWMKLVDPPLVVDRELAHRLDRWLTTLEQ